MKWYLIQTKPNRYKLAEEHLLRQGYNVFLPLMKKTSKKGVKFVNNLIPLFPGYLFLGSKLENIPWKSINATRGVSKAITLDGQYRSIRYEIIKGIKSRCDQNDILKSMEHIKASDRARIESGPFADFICSVEKIDDRNRAWVLIDLLQQQTYTIISSNNLIKIK